MPADARAHNARYRARCIPASCRSPLLTKTRSTIKFLAKGKLLMPMSAIDGEKSF